MTFVKKAAGLAATVLMTASASYADVDNKLADPRVRQAIAYAIDMDTVVDTLFEGKAIVADSMIPNGAWKAPGLNAYTYDPEKARELLQDANWDKDQVLDVVYCYGYQLTVDFMTAIQAYLADVGMKMTFRKLEGDVIGQLTTVPDDPKSNTSAVTWDICYGAKAALVLHEYYNVYLEGKSAYTPTDATRNELLQRINGTPNLDEQKSAFADFQRYESEMLSDIPLYYQQLFIFESKRVDRKGGQYGNAQFNYDWNIVNWEVEPDENGKRILYTNKGPIQFFVQPWLNPGLKMSSKVVFDRLMTADGSLVPTGPQLAQSYDVSEDGKTVTFVLKDGLTWHDGAPLTAEDVSWSIHTALGSSSLNGVFTNTFKSIEGAEAFIKGDAETISGISVDGNALTLKFAVLDPNMLVTFSQFPPLPKHKLEGVNPVELQQHPFWQYPIGSGPFKVAEVQMNDFARFVPFENYHGGIAKIDEIVAFPSEDNDPNVVKNAAAGRLDYGFTKSVADIQALEGMDHMRVIAADIPYTRSLRINAFPKKPEE